MAQTSVRVQFRAAEDIEDAALVRIDDALEARDFPVGHDIAVRSTDDDPASPPFDVEVVKPRAVDLRKLWSLTGQEIPADVQATLGPSIPILLYQGMTPFHKPGAKKQRVGAMGYEVQIADSDASTVSLAPETRTYTAGKLDASTQVGLSADGELAVPETALQAIRVLPGVSLDGARLEVTSHAMFKISIQLDLQVLEIQAGPVRAGGARWNFYAARERLDRFQPLLHTLLIPENTRTLSVAIKTWVRRPARWLGLVKAKQWTSETIPFQISLEGLGA